MNRTELMADLEARVNKAQELVGKPDRQDEFKSLTGQIETIGEQIRAFDKAAEVRASLANVPAPAPAVEQRTVRPGSWNEVRNVLRQMAESRTGGKLTLGYDEIRAVTANGLGKNTAPGLVKALVDGGKLRSRVSVFTGKNSETIIPVLAPHMAIPVGTAEGATGTSSDSTAVLGAKSLIPKPWYSTLAVSMGALISTDIESFMPGIFDDAFGQAIDKMILVGAGSGYDGLGVFIASSSGVTTSQDIACAAAGTPKWVDFAKMALALKGTMNGDQSQLVIVAHPDIIAPLLAETTTATDPYKVELLTRGTILGIPVIYSSFGLTTLTAGSYVAVGGYFNHYALGISQEITVDQIKTVGSDNITFQSFVYMNGTPLLGTSFRRLKTI